MEPSEEITFLLQSIQDTVQLFINEHITFEEAKKKFNSFKGQYNKLLSSYKISSMQSDISGLLYQHNCNNFSKLTSLLVYKEDELTELHAVGDRAFSPAITEYILTEGVDNFSNGFKVKFIKRLNNMPHNMYVFTIAINNIVYFLCTVSASTFFSEEKFKHVGNVFNIILHHDHHDPLEFRIIDSYKQILEQFLHDDEIESKCIDVFIFDSLLYVFSHLDYRSFFSLAKYITNTLQTLYPETVFVEQLSYSNYIVLYNKHDVSEGLHKQLFFSFNNIPIAYKAIQIVVKPDVSLNELLEEIYDVEEYLKSGDIFI